MAESDKKPVNEKIQELAQRLAETEDVLHSLTSGQIDAIVDPASGTPILLNAAQLHAIKKGLTVSNVEIVLRYANGPSRIILAGASPVLDESGHVIGGVTVFQDITKANHIQTKLHRHTYSLKILHEIIQAILSARSVKEPAYSALCFVPQLIDCIRCSIKIFNRESAEMSVLAVYSESETEKLAQSLARC